jgi:hypothetical protein
MKLKVAHLIAVQFGIVIGIVICLVVLRFESPKPTAAEMRGLATERAAAIDRASEPHDELGDLADNREKLEPVEPLADQLSYPLPNEYSPEAAEQSMAVITKLYYEQIAPKRKASSNRANSSAADIAPSYTEAAPQPEVVQYEEPAPQPVAYVQPTQTVVYYQPVPVVVFSNPRRFDNRCRPAPHPGSVASNSHRRSDSRGTHLSGSPGPRSPRSSGAERRTTAATQGFIARGKR